MPLFYFHARKIVRLARLYGKPVPFYIMTSDVNDAATRACFEDHDYFGLNPADVIFFKQGVWPAPGCRRPSDPRGARADIRQSGRAWRHVTALAKNGCLDDMTARGIRSVFYFQVDNPLVDIADPAFIGLHALCGAELSLKLCLKRSPTEKDGRGVAAR
jgi:UDP-N-acetylglucosamine/UDP-N-acetylgalactosamine diphosphorylase